MDFELIVILLLTLIFTLLFFLLLKSSKKIENSDQKEISKINDQLNVLLHKTLEQTGYVNSKIDEIGDLTKKMTNAMTSNISDMGQMGEIILENILQDCGMTKIVITKLNLQTKMKTVKNLDQILLFFYQKTEILLLTQKFQ